MLKESTKCKIRCLACFKEVRRLRELKDGICKECIGCVGKQSYTSKATANAALYWMKEDFQKNAWTCGRNDERAACPREVGTGTCSAPS